MDTSSRERLASATEALSTLSEYLERSLDNGASFILVRSRNEQSDVYLGNPAEPQSEWTHCGVIRNTVGAAILEATRSGSNELSIDGQTYRFIRTFTQVAEHGAVVFSPA
ncbi:MAG: hypothetical protein EPN70_21305 [Paraburkholderia sp.]|uniref:hypothetical protein n=1 Tax=Paraburkholderia sp. TaxID=1926495 RepID=UPI0011F7C4DE|nr:hypothetical protein [Paraburkholderia sp.]TAM00776.1 MAG: hypothetical protein EPN70_21305 [Paraburkholderia sp.]